MTIDWREIEERWQREWERSRIFEADPDPNRPKFFLTVAYPYPNSPQHVGHGRTFTLTDVYARYKRMRGFNVLFPMAFHYTGTPILAMSKRVAAGDEELIDEFTRLYRVPPEVVKEFVEPIRIAGYFHREIRQGMKEIGYSIDWRREFTTVVPAYSRFIEWQFHRLRSKGLITRGSHPVGWCPSCGSPMGQHDTRGDVEPEIGEYVVIKFMIDGAYLPTATLRPETVFGVTNIWVRPDVEYVRARVDGESWIVSMECADKLALLKREVSVIDTVSGRELLGRNVENPVTKRRIPILPASFVDPKNATGVVMSVPGHAPYDYIALEDLRKHPDELSRFGVRTTILEDVKPVSIIALEGYSELPAADALKRLGVTDQLDPKVEEATREVYSHEYHRGRMKGNTGAYAGMTVPQARERITEDLIRDGRGDTMYELLNRPVFCRCGAELVVNIFEDQWFIDYDNPEWKRLAHECLENMKIVPEGMREEFRNVIDWLKKKACARKHGLGTRLPWDPERIIESLS
ncbi:MAG: leucine--tRNA ligase, partial [Candidatus Bathyarchaeia archaeon]